MLKHKLFIRILVAFLFFIAFMEVILNLIALDTEKKANAYANKLLYEEEENAGSQGNKAELSRDSTEHLLSDARRSFIDSVANQALIDVGFFKDITTYRFCSKLAMVPGTDVSTRLHLVFQVQQPDLLRSLAENDNNLQFVSAIDNAAKLWPDKQADFLDLFKREYEQTDGNARLSDIFKALPMFSDHIKAGSSDNEVITALHKEFENAFAETFKIIKLRIAGTGLHALKTELKPDIGCVLIDLEDVESPAKTTWLLQREGKLSFWNTYDTREVFGFFNKANTILANTIGKNGINKKQEGKAGPIKSDLQRAMLNDSVSDDAKSNTNCMTSGSKLPVNPLFEVLYPNLTKDAGLEEGPMIGRSFAKDTAEVNRLLNLTEISRLFPPDLKLAWSGHRIARDYNVYGLYAMKKNPDWAGGALSGDIIKNAAYSFDETGMPEVDISMTQQASEVWEEMTEVAADSRIADMPVKRCIAIMFDNQVFSAPRVMQKITGGFSQITGIEDIKEAKELATIINAGRLHTHIIVVEQRLNRPLITGTIFRNRLMALFLWAALALFCFFFFFRI